MTSIFLTDTSVSLDTALKSKSSPPVEGTGDAFQDVLIAATQDTTTTTGETKPSIPMLQVATETTVPQPSLVKQIFSLPMAATGEGVELDALDETDLALVMAGNEGVIENPIAISHTPALIEAETALPTPALQSAELLTLMNPEATVQPDILAPVIAPMIDPSIKPSEAAKPGKSPLMSLPTTLAPTPLEPTLSGLPLTVKPSPEATLPIASSPLQITEFEAVIDNKLTALTTTTAVSEVIEPMPNTAQVALPQSVQSQSAPVIPQTVVPQQVSAPTIIPTTDPLWADKMVEHIKQSFNEGMPTLDIKLTPENIGTVNIRLELRGDIANVQIVTETQDAQRLFNDNQNRLSEMFSKAGMELGQHSSNTFSQNGNGKGSQQGQMTAGQEETSQFDTTEPRPKTTNTLVDLVA